MSTMPRLTTPPEMPREVAGAIETIGNRARTELLHQLGTCGPLTTTELADRIAAPRTSTHTHLVQLERAGLVVADEATGQRRGRTVRWSLNRQKVREAADAWSAYANGEPPACV